MEHKSKGVNITLRTNTLIDTILKSWKYKMYLET